MSKTKIIHTEYWIERFIYLMFSVVLLCAAYSMYHYYSAPEMKMKTGQMVTIKVTGATGQILGVSRTGYRIRYGMSTTDVGWFEEIEVEPSKAEAVE